MIVIKNNCKHWIVAWMVPTTKKWLKQTRDSFLSDATVAVAAWHRGNPDENEMQLLPLRDFDAILFVCE